MQRNQHRKKPVRYTDTEKTRRLHSPLTMTVPTPGVFAEAMMGACNACEKIDETRTQDWTRFTADDPTAITADMLASRYQNVGNLQTKDLPQPIVNIQNTPPAPDPQGVNAMAGLLGKSDLFKDITGLQGTQDLAKAAMTGSQDMVKTAEANAANMANLAMQYNLQREAIKAGLMTKQQAAQNLQKGLNEQGKTPAERASDAYKRQIADIQSTTDLSPEDKKAAIAALTKKYTKHGGAADEENPLYGILNDDPEFAKNYLNSGGKITTNADGTVTMEGGSGIHEDELCCDEAINNWETLIRKPIFSQITNQNNATNFTSTANILLFLQPIKSALETQYRSERWFNFCSRNKKTKSEMTNTLMTNQTDIKLISISNLTSINQTQSNAFNSVPIPVNIPTNLSYLLPYRSALGKQYSSCIRANSPLWDLPFTILGIQYSFNAYSDSDMLSFQDGSNNNIIPPMVYGTPGQAISVTMPLPTARSINNAFIPISALNGANSFVAIVRPVGTSLQTSIYDLQIDLIVLDPWPFGH